MKLLELQRRMAADIMRPLSGDDELSPRAGECDYLTANDRLTSRERLQIYSRSYWYRLLDSLYDDYPGLRAIIGDDLFHQMSRAYLAAHPSQSFTMRNLGHALESWMRSRRQYTAGQHALAIEMARLEWAHIEAFDGPSLQPLGPEDLLELGPDLRVGLQPCIGLLRLRYAVDDLRISVTRKQDLHEAASNAVTAPRHQKSRRKTLRREKSPLHVAVHRYNDMVYYRRLEPEAYRILSAFRAGLPIGAALEEGFAGIVLTPEDYQTAISTWFAAWAELGWLCRPTL